MNTAIVLTAGMLDNGHAKTAHGLIRESGRFEVIAVVDARQAGRDAGEVLDGMHRNIPVLADIHQALKRHPTYCIVGVATSGGIFPPAMLEDIKVALAHGVSVVNGLHDCLGDREDIRALAQAHGATLLDIRKPKKFGELRFWTGKILQLQTPVVAVLGTDCSLGKRTTTRLLVAAAREGKLKAEMVYTGQTGWLQGGKYGFILDATLNDFVPGELEHAILTCAEEANPDLILLEGQSAMRNPSGPCGAEMLLSARAKHVVLVHAPKRKYYDELAEWGEIPSLESEIQLVQLYGAKVFAIVLNTQHCTTEEAHALQREYEDRLGIVTVLPLQEGCGRVVPLLREITKKAHEHQIN